MCGFVGVFPTSRARWVDPRVVVAMRDLMSHRGPDMADVRVGEGFGLGFRRLAILDLSEAANQPMTDASGRVHLVFNGEIYNHHALRDRLGARGHTFRTRCDTEALLAAYLEWGSACVTELEGMFAFVVHDERDGTTFVARDAVGIKPLYLTRVSPDGGDDAWLIASESKSFFGHPAFRTSLDASSLGELFAFRFVAGDKTPMEGVVRLLPGHSATLRGGELTIRRWYDVRHAAGQRGDAPDPTSFSALVEAAVHGELESDVPLGTQLSGGVDSGVVTALAARGSARPVQTFTVYFEGGAKEGDERAGARRVAQRVGAEVHEIALDARRFSAELGELTWHLDEPMNHPNSVAVFGLCREAKRHATVLLSGDGPDELLAGYDRHGSTLRMLQIARCVPHAIRRATDWLPPLGLRRRGELLESALRDSPEELLLLSSAYGSPRRLRALGLEQDCVGPYRRESLATATGSPLARMLIVDIECYLGAVLLRQDKMSMAASVETRVPYLERRVIDACVAMPDRHKRRGPVGKRILRDIAVGLLGDSLQTAGPKIGFGVPLGAWLREDPLLAARLDSCRRGAAQVCRHVPRALVDHALAGLAIGGREETELAWMLVSLDHYVDMLAGAPERGRQARRVAGLEA